MQRTGESAFAEFFEPPLRLQDHTLRDLPFHPQSLAPPRNHQNRQNHRPRSLHHHCLLHHRQVVALPVLSPLHIVYRSHQQTRPHRPSSGLLVAGPRRWVKIISNGTVPWYFFTMATLALFSLSHI